MKALLSCTILLLLGASLSSAGILVSSETSASAEKQDVYGPVFSSGGSFGYGTFVNPVYRWPSVSTGILWPGNIPVQTIPLYPYSPSVPGGPPILEDDENSNREPLMPDNGDYVDPETGLSRDKREVPFVEDAAWWNGPNVCVTRTENSCTDNEKEENWFQFEVFSCKESKTMYKCFHKERTNEETKTYTLTRQCCFGYSLQNGICTKVDLFPVMETIEKLQGTEFMALSKDFEEYISDQNITVFLPSNQAFERYLDVMLHPSFQDAPMRQRRDLDEATKTQLILNHLVDGLHDIYPDDSLESMYNTSLIIKSAADGTLLVNCIPVAKSNIQAVNAVIHQINRVLVPVESSIMDILEDRSDLSIFYNLLKDTDLINDYDTWTLFVPSNDAFEKLDQHFMKRLQKNSGCMKNVLRHHMIPEHLCSASVGPKINYIKNSMNYAIHLTIPESAEMDNEIDDNEYTGQNFNVDTAKVIKTDIVATNGVIHIIDKVLVPDTALPLNTMLLKKNLTVFHDIIKKSGLMEESLTWKNVTLFVPTDSAILNYSLKYGNEFLNSEDSLNRLIKDDVRKELQNFVHQHIVPKRIGSCALQDNEILSTMDKNKNIRTNIYTTVNSVNHLPPFLNIYNRATVDCARLLHFDNEQCDNILHRIDRPLYRYSNTVLGEIKKRPELSTLAKLLNGTEVENILDNSTDITFVAPTNEVFEKMNKIEFEELRTKKELIVKLFRLHTVKGVLCCLGLQNLPWPLDSLMTYFGEQRITYNYKRIGSAIISKCDIMASNGVMHLSDSLMFKQLHVKSKSKNIDVALYGI